MALGHSHPPFLVRLCPLKVVCIYNTRLYYAKLGFAFEKWGIFLGRLILGKLLKAPFRFRGRENRVSVKFYLKRASANGPRTRERGRCGNGPRQSEMRFSPCASPLAGLRRAKPEGEGARLAGSCREVRSKCGGHDAPGWAALRDILYKR